MKYLSKIILTSQNSHEHENPSKRLSLQNSDYRLNPILKWRKKHPLPFPTTLAAKPLTLKQNLAPLTSRAPHTFREPRDKTQRRSSRPIWYQLPRPSDPPMYRPPHICTRGGATKGAIDRKLLNPGRARARPCVKRHQPRRTRALNYPNASARRIAQGSRYRTYIVGPLLSRPLIYRRRRKLLRNARNERGKRAKLRKIARGGSGNR